MYCEMRSCSPPSRMMRLPAGRQVRNTRIATLRQAQGDKGAVGQQRIAPVPTSREYAMRACQQKAGNRGYSTPPARIFFNCSTKDATYFWVMRHKVSSSIRR